MDIIRADLLDAIKKYDTRHKTNFAEILPRKIAKCDSSYKRGVIHGLCLALVQNGVLTNDDAMEIVKNLIYA